MSPSEFRALLEKAKEGHYEGPDNHGAIMATWHRAALFAELWAVADEYTNHAVGTRPDLGLKLTAVLAKLASIP